MTGQGHTSERSTIKLITWIIITLLLIVLTLLVSRSKIKAIEDQQKPLGQWPQPGPQERPHSVFILTLNHTRL